MDPTQRYLWHRQIWKSDQFRCNWLHVPALLLILYHCTPLCDSFCSSNLSLPFPPPKELLLTWLPLPLLRLPMQTRYVYAFILFIGYLSDNQYDRLLWTGMLVSTPSPSRLKRSYSNADSSSMSWLLVMSMAVSFSCSLSCLPFSLTFGHPGQTGLGKSTLVNTIFASHLIDSKGRLEAAEPPRQTTEIEQVSHCKSYHHVPELYSSPMLLLLLSKCSDWRTRCALETQYRRYSRLWWSSQQWELVCCHLEPCQDTYTYCISWEPIVKYIKDQHSAYLRKELTAQRDRYITDSRVHCCLFFITPSGHSYVGSHSYHLITWYSSLLLGSNLLTLSCWKNCQKLSMSCLWLLNRIAWPWKSVKPLDNVYVYAVIFGMILLLMGTW